MRRKWSEAAIRQLVEAADKYDGKRSDYLNSIGMKSSQFYKLKNKIYGNKTRLSRDLPSTQQVVQLISGTQESLRMELAFPGGHKLTITGNLSESVFASILNLINQHA